MKTVFVGLSGGVDSAVSAYLLKQQGFRVVGVFLKVWEPDFLPCTSGQDRLDAMRVAAHLKIPFLSYDFEQEYKEHVVDYFISEYRSGRTPNPDVLCNRAIKFDAFWREAKKEGADFIATGHYAQIKPVNGDELSVKSADQKNVLGMFRGADTSKDQSYFLWTLTQEDLSHTLFPVGGLQKSEVRRIADSIHMPNATKKDSQGLCFLGHVDMKEFLEHYIPKNPGSVVDEKGAEVGEHDGVQFYTLGERFSLAHGQKMFVVRKNIQKNELVIGPAPDISLPVSEALIHNLIWNSMKPLDGELLHAQTRYHGPSYRALVSGNRVSFKEPARAVSGQSVVFYDTNNVRCLGGAHIA